MEVGVLCGGCCQRRCVPVCPILRACPGPGPGPPREPGHHVHRGSQATCDLALGLSQSTHWLSPQPRPSRPLRTLVSRSSITELASGVRGAWPLTGAGRESHVWAQMGCPQKRLATKRATSLSTRSARALHLLCMQSASFSLASHTPTRRRTWPARSRHHPRLREAVCTGAELRQVWRCLRCRVFRRRRCSPRSSGYE